MSINRVIEVEKCTISEEMSSRQITDLPLEMISRILSLLPYYPDFQNARLVCNKLYTASLDISFLSREEVVFGNDNYPVDLRSLLRSERRFIHFRFLNHTSFSPDPEVWFHLGPTLKSLSLSYCDLTEDQLFGILTHCTSLKHLVLESCSVKISCSAPTGPLDDYSLLNFTDSSPPQLNLRSFSVGNELDPRLFWRILKHTPNLKSLSVDRFQGIRSYSFIPRWQNGDDSATIPLDVDDIFAYLKVCGHRLRDLQLILNESKPRNNGSDAKEKLSTALSQINNLRLRKFSTNVEVEKEFFLKQKECLEELILGHVTNDVLAVICRELQNLKHLDVTTVLFTASDAKLFTVPQNLVSLRVSLLYRPTILDSDVCVGLCGKVNTTLKVLDLCHTVDKVFVSPECISSLAQTFQTLTDLNLYACDGVNDASMQAIFRHMLSLESLQLCQCRNLCDAAIKRTPQNADGSTGSEKYSITRLKKLRLLDLSCCMKFTGEAFNSDLKLPELRQLNLSYNEISRECLVRLSENNPTIEHLSLDGCVELTDDLVSILVNNFSRLRYINIGMRSNISEQGLKLLKKRCPRVYTCAWSEEQVTDTFTCTSLL